MDKDSTLPDPMLRTTVYIPKSVLDGLDKCVELEGRGTSRSKILTKLGARYAAAHIKGNPQLPLLNWIGNVQMQCFFCAMHKTQLVKAEFVSGLVAPICQECLDTDSSVKLTLKRKMGVWKMGDKILGLPK